jgi:hypothetical protein
MCDLADCLHCEFVTPGILQSVRNFKRKQHDTKRPEAYRDDNGVVLELIPFGQFNSELNITIKSKALQSSED